MLVPVNFMYHYLNVGRSKGFDNMLVLVNFEYHSLTSWQIQRF